jgi:hypothetical protein
VSRKFLTALFNYFFVSEEDGIVGVFERWDVSVPFNIRHEY